MNEFPASVHLEAITTRVRFVIFPCSGIYIDLVENQLINCFHKINQQLKVPILKIDIWLIFRSGR